MDTKSKKILIGVLAGVVALCMFFGIVGATFRAGMMLSGRNVGYSRAVPQAVPPAAPQDDVLPAPQAP
ncbi:MAG: hypothetical protein HC853_18340, partial [Anaerolineae bacterium]|nr:hypothetical protein [Anaerolineae bacterium]